MNFTLHCGHYHPELEEAFAPALERLLKDRANPLSEQILAVAPTGALRRRLVEVAAAGRTGPLVGVEMASIDPLCVQIAVAALHAPQRMITDSLYYAALIQKIAWHEDLLPASNFRICRAVYQTMRDLQDGAVSPSLLEEVLDAAESDPELQSQVHSTWLRRLTTLASRMEESLESAGVLNLPLATRLAAEAAPDCVRLRRMTGLLIYGFYDSTESQFMLIENLARAVVQNGGAVHAFFPFPVNGHSVEHPYEYAQTFLDRLFSLEASVGGTTNRLPHAIEGASAGIESSLFAAGQPRSSEPAGKAQSASRRLEQLDLFAEPPPVAGPAPQIEIISAAGEHDEAWAVAKKILTLALAGASFDQILILARSGGAELEPLLHVLRQNRIPCNRAPGRALSCGPFAKFAVLALEAREAGLAPAVLMELLSSPFLLRPNGNDFQRLAELMENLMIRSWADWERLEPLLVEGKLPEFYGFLEERDQLSLRALREMIRRIQELKSHLQQIPERASLPDFAAALMQTLDAMSGQGGERPVMDLLRRMAGYRELDEPELTLAGFIDSFKMHLQEAVVEAPESAGVTVADIMQARGTTADYVFVTGLNRDVFPRRTQEDPFLPDRTRRLLRELTGAGPAEKRTRSLLPLKEGTDEELLLFALALRTGRKHLFLSYRRADEAGRKAAISNYLDELLRLLTGKTSENNERVVAVPKHHASKFSGDSLPTLEEWAALPSRCSPEEWLEHHHLHPGYAARVREFGARLSQTALEPSREVDGIVEDPAAFWKRHNPQKPAVTISYSRLKSYLQCPFQFFARNVLLLQESPRDTGQEDHDLDARLKGRMAEDVVKLAMGALGSGERGVEASVDSAARRIRHRYAPLLPPVLLDVYMDAFRAGAGAVLKHLERNGFDLAASEAPQYENMISMELLPGQAGLPPLILRGIPDLILRHRWDEGLIGELKWGARSVGKAPGQVLSANEAQFCTYPELVRADRGVELSFRYLRMDAFAAFGDPDDLQARLNRIPVKTNIQKENAVRIFGARVEFRVASEYLDKVKKDATRLREGDFRIVKDPNLQFGPCRHCGFTQICRRTHTETLLRAKQAEKE